MSVLSLSADYIKVVQVVAAFCQKMGIQFSQIHLYEKDEYGYPVEVETNDQPNIKLKVSLKNKTVTEFGTSLYYGGSFTTENKFEEASESAFQFPASVVN